MTADAILTILMNAAIAAIIFFVGKWLASKITFFAKGMMARKGLDEMLISFLGSIVYLLLLAFVIVAALNRLGVDTTSAVAIIGAAGLAIGFALQGSLSNFASGVMIVFFKPFVKGDFVIAGGDAGIVEELTMFTTTLKSPDNKTIIVPNSQFTSGSITNISRQPTRRVDLIFGVGYDANLDEVKATIQEVLATCSEILPEPEPTIGVAELADSSVNFAVRPWVNKDDYWTVYFYLHEAMKKAFDAKGIAIPFPQHDVHLYKENA